MVARKIRSSIPPKKTSIIRPRKLQPGDTISIVAPASPPLTPEVFDIAREKLESAGFKVQISTLAKKRLGFLAGSDSDRLKDFNRALSNPKVRALLCVRGGHGCLRLVDSIDLGAFRRDPKLIIGLSDVTTLHCLFNSQLNASTLHGPVAQGLTQPDCPPFTWHSFIQSISAEREPPVSICEGYADYDKTVYSLKRGVATGRLVGGNLTILTSLLGTKLFPALDGKILFLEDIGEMPFRIDRCLTRLVQSGVLNKVAGFALGLFKDCEYRPFKEGDLVEYKQTLRDVFKDRLSPLGKPIVVGLPFGHTPHNASIPTLALATLDGNKRDLILEESPFS